MSYTIYYNGRCSKCRTALQKLDNTGEEVTVIKYLETSPKAEELVDLLKKLGIKAEDLIRKTEPIYKEEFKDKNLSEQEWIAAMVKYPKLIQRPVVVKGEKAVIARPVDNMDELL